MFMEMMGIKPTGNKVADTAIGAGMDPMNWLLALLAARAHINAGTARKTLDAVGGDAPAFQKLLQSSLGDRNNVLSTMMGVNAIEAPLRPLVADFADDEDEQEEPKIDTKKFYGDPGMLMPRERLRRRYRDQFGVDASEAELM